MSVAILVVGYDKYEDVWENYFELLNKYWKERPKTYLATSCKTPIYDGVNVIVAGEGSEWSTKARKALDIIKEKYVVLLLEDFFTTRKVDSNRLFHVIDIMEENNLNFCKLLDQKKMKGKKFKNEKYVKIIPRNDKYGLCLEPAVWKKDYLYSLIGTGNYDPWVFEFKLLDLQLHNKEKIDSIQENSNILEITHGIVQGQYLPKCIKVFKKQGYHFNLENKSIFSFKNNFKYNLKCFVNFHSPEWSKKFLKKIGRLMGVDFVSDRVLGGRK